MKVLTHTDETGKTA